MVFDGERYIAVGDDATVITSYDAKFWDKVDVYGLDTNINFVGYFENTNSVTSAGDKYIYLGANESATSGDENEGGLWLAKDDINHYTDGVFETSIAPGSEGAYTRIFVDTKTPRYLRYYCQQHGFNMGAMIYFESKSISKIYMMTEHENGFSTGTDFYVVNTVSPKVLEVVNGSATAEDTRPFIDITQTLTIDETDTPGIPNANRTTLGYDQPDETGNQIMGYKGSYEVKFGPQDVDYTQNTISFDEDHSFCTMVLLCTTIQCLVINQLVVYKEAWFTTFV